MINNYFIRARLFPAMITGLPVMILANCLMNQYLREQLSNYDGWIKAVTDLGLSSALIYMLMQINRFISKEIFQHFIFKEEDFMPTTNYLLYRNSFYDISIKERIREKILSRYGVVLLTGLEENADENRARKLIVSTTALIRNDLRGNGLLLQHNAEYGFVRNLAGGSVIAFLASIGLLLYATSVGNALIQSAAVLMALCYLIFLLASKGLIARYGEYYAKILFEQFLSLQANATI